MHAPAGSQRPPPPRTRTHPLSLFLFSLSRVCYSLTLLNCMQVCTACANAFAHGSNEVANAVGPLAAIYQVWQESAVRASAPVPAWLLAIGGFGICFGLATCE